MIQISSKPTRSIEWATLTSVKKNRFRMCLAGIIAAVFIASITSSAQVGSSPPGPERATDLEISGSHVPVRAAERGHPWINLRDKVRLSSVYTGAQGLNALLGRNLVEPLSLASADFNEDGVMDLVSGYAGPHGGILTLHRGGADSGGLNGRNTSELRGKNSGVTVGSIPFSQEAQAIALPEAPEFLGAGDFDGDGHCDVVAAARRTGRLYVMPGNGRGGFGPAQRLDLAGQVTALVTGEINRADGLADIVVGLAGPHGAAVLVFESPRGALRGDPEVFSLSAPATSLALGQLDERYEKDLAVAAGHEVLIVHGRDRKLSLGRIRQSEVSHAIVDRHPFRSSIRSLALGDFVWDQRHRTEIALLLDDGTVHMMKKAEGRVEEAGEWVGETASKDQRLGTCDRVIRAKVSSVPADDLVFIDSTHRRLHILIGDARKWKEVEPAAHVPQSVGFPAPVSLDVEGTPAAILPMRLNRDAFSDLVILTETGPQVTVTAPLNRYVVTTNIDTFDPPPVFPPEVLPLRWAVQYANASPGFDLIQFDIGEIEDGPYTISLLGPLPTITEPLEIDAGEPDYCGPARIELDGIMAGRNARGLEIIAGNSTIWSLAINRFDGDGIYLSSNGENEIHCSFIGTDPAGSVASPNLRGVLIEDSPRNMIGGERGWGQNVLSGNFNEGVGIFGGGAVENIVLGNFIGTDVNGATALPNSLVGIRIGDGAGNNLIGGTSPGARNVISGNESGGIDISGSTTMGNVLQSNFIGTDDTGMAALGNGAAGIAIADAPGTTIGGTTSDARNIISGNVWGIALLYEEGTATLIQGNYIGVDVTGDHALGNLLDGMRLEAGAHDNAVGGLEPGAGNVIAHNGNSGVVIESGLGNGILSNSIFSNRGLGIDLGDDGVTANDDGDGDVGPNNLQNAPIIATVSSDDVSRTTTVEGTLNSMPDTVFTVQFFANSGCDPFGTLTVEGRTYIGSRSVRTDETGNAGFRATLNFLFSPATPEPHFITATATDPGNNTSEFSQLMLLNCLPDLKVEPLALAFGNQLVFTPSAPFPVYLRNDGRVNLTISGITLAGSQPADFMLSGPPALPAVISPGQTLTVNVVFKPLRVGGQTASLLISSNDPNEPTVAVSLTGVGVAPDIDVSPPSLMFGNQCITVQSAPQSVTIRNVGSAPLTITSGVGPSCYPITGLAPLPRTIAAGSALVFTVAFKPADVGTETGSISISSDDPDEPVTTVNLSGSGVAQNLDITPSTPLSFGGQLINTQSPPQTLTILNSSSSCTGRVTTITLGGANPNDFVLLNVPSLPRTVGPNQRFAFEVAFRPMTVGSRAAVVTITSDDPDEPTQTIGMNGTGTAPDIHATPASLAFGNQCINTQSAAQSVTVSNSGTAPLTVTGITHSNPTDFVLMVTPSPPRTIPPGGNFIFTIAFAPTTSGTRTGTIAIASDDPDEPTTSVSMNGVGIASPQDIDVNPTSFAFGNQCINTESAPRTVTVSNTSTCTALSVTGLTKTGIEFLLSGLPPLPRTVPPGGSFTFSVSFKPTTVGAKSGSVSISSNDPDEPTRTVMLSGTGVAQNMMVNPTSISFGNQTVGTTSGARTVTVTNTGSCALTVTEIKLEGANPGEFLLNALPTLPRTVAPGGSILFEVRFRPTVSGARSASVTMTSNDPDQPIVSIPLTGIGT